MVSFFNHSNQFVIASCKVPNLILKGENSVYLPYPQGTRDLIGYLKEDVGHRGRRQFRIQNGSGQVENVSVIHGDMTVKIANAIVTHLSGNLGVPGSKIQICYGDSNDGGLLKVGILASSFDCVTEFLVEGVMSVF